MQQSIDLKCTVNREYLQSGYSALVYVAMDITPPQAAGLRSTQRPLNICITIDCSGSMQEEGKLDNAKIAALQLIQSLKPTDIVSLVSFSDKETIEVSARQAIDIVPFNRAMDALSPNGGTDIYSALQAAMNEVASQKSNFTQPPVNRIILITDGQPTVGKEKAEQFVPLCEEIRKNDTSITALGIGSDYNEKLLFTVGSTTGGIWQHVVDPNSLAMLFSQELAEMSTIVMLKPQLTIQPMSGAEMADIHKVRPVLDLIKDPQINQGKYMLPLGDLVGGQPQNIVAKLRLPPRAEGTYRIAQVTLNGGGSSTTQDIVVNYTNDPNNYSKETNPYPRVLLMTSQSTILLRQGVASGDETIINQAQTVLKKTMADPNAATIVKTNDLTKDLVSRFNNSYEQTIIKKGNLSEEDKKKVIAQTTVIKRN